MRVAMLTTIDNPFDPFRSFEDWKGYDDQLGYHSCEYLARVALTSPLLPPGDTLRSVEQAIDDIVLGDPLGVYRKVVREVS